MRVASIFSSSSWQVTVKMSWRGIKLCFPSLKGNVESRPSFGLEIIGQNFVLFLVDKVFLYLVLFCLSAPPLLLLPVMETTEWSIHFCLKCLAASGMIKWVTSSAEEDWMSLDFSQMFTTADEKYFYGNRLNYCVVKQGSDTFIYSYWKRFSHWMLILYINDFLFCNLFESTVSSSPYSVRSFFSLRLLLWFFSLCRLFRLPPREEVVGDQSCEKVCSHASVFSQYQTQRLRQHKQTEHVHGRPVIQLHPIVLCGFHHSKKIHQCHRRVEGQLHHDAEDRMLQCSRKPLDLTCAHVLESSL